MRINLSKVTTKDLATLAERVINSSKNDKYTVVAGNELLAAVEAQYNTYEKVYSKLTFSGKGADVSALDRNRDEKISAIRGLAKAVAALPALPNNQAGVEVSSVFDTYAKGLEALSYASETAQIKKLFEALDTEAMQENITALNLTSTYEELKKTQTDFETLYAKQAEANADLRALPSATASRKNLETALRAYLSLLTAMKTVQSWQMIYQDINEIVKGIVGSTRPNTPPIPDGSYKPMNPPREETQEITE